MWPQAETKELDFGNMLVDSRQSRSLVLLNDGNCTLYYRLYLEQHSPEGPNQDPPGTGPGLDWDQGRYVNMGVWQGCPLRQVTTPWSGAD